MCIIIYRAEKVIAMFQTQEDAVTYLETGQNPRHYDDYDSYAAKECSVVLEGLVKALMVEWIKDVELGVEGGGKKKKKTKTTTTTD